MDMSQSAAAAAAAQQAQQAQQQQAEALRMQHAEALIRYANCLLQGPSYKYLTIFVHNNT
nr:unnamed protein product [Callosobruchus analis]